MGNVPWKFSRKVSYMFLSYDQFLLIIASLHIITFNQPIISILPGPGPTIQFYRDRDMTGMTRTIGMTGMTGTKTGILILKAVSCKIHLHYLSLYFTLILEQVSRSCDHLVSTQVTLKSKDSS